MRASQGAATKHPSASLRLARYGVLVSVLVATVDAQPRSPLAAAIVATFAATSISVPAIAFTTAVVACATAAGVVSAGSVQPPV